MPCCSPYKFEAPWSAWEFAYHIIHKEANLVILSMAWLTREDARSYSRCPKDPDMETLSYWLARLEPLIRAETEGEIICVFANRSGIEEEAVYAGTSAVLGIHAGEVKVYGILGRGEKELLVVDTNKRPQAKLVSQPNSTVSDANDDQRDIKGDPKDDKPSEKAGKAEKAEKAEINLTAEFNAESSAETSTDERTNSTVSDMSDLSVNTQMTACTTPDFPQACFPKSMEDVVTPLSPVDANSPSVFFAPRCRRPDGDTLRESLKSSIGQQEFQAAKPDSPTFVRPASPKSRNASRTRQLEYQEPALRTHDLAQEEQVTRKDSPVVFRPPSPKSRNASRTRQLEYQEPALRTHDLAQEEQVTRKGSPAIFRPQSPKPRNATRTLEPEHQELALASHDLAKEEQIIHRVIGIQSPVQPHSAAAAPDRHNPSSSPTYFGSRRSISLSPRPKSTIW
jgi:protein N-terminal amidase